MKKFFALMLVTTMLISSTANAGILILTGDIGNKFSGYKAVGIVTILLTGATIIGLVVDQDNAVDSSVKIPELSEASVAMIQDATAEAAAQSNGQEIMATISASLANQIVALEGLEGSAQGELLFATLTK
ncbi:MAG: hypothetical protein ACJ76H_07760 [Bacteriovoracaceae bacterium]